MKRIIVLMMALISLLAVLSGCKKGKKINVELNIDEIRNLNELASLKCTYHNIITLDETKKKFFTIKDDYSYWVEYDGWYEVGIDLSNMTIETEKTEITAGDTNNKVNVIITLPHSKLLSTNIDEESFSKYDIVKSKDAVFKSKVKFDLEKSGEMIGTAEEEMSKRLTESRINFDIADKYSQEIIENYISAIGEKIGVEYVIKWKWLEEAEEGEGEQQ